MKPSYELLGIFWDRKIPAEIPVEIVESDDIAPSFERPRNLFDLNSYRRSIPISTLLSMSSERQLESCLLGAEYCDSIQIVLDYEPNAGAVAAELYERRVLQIAGEINRLIPESHVRIVKSRTGQTRPPIGKELGWLFQQADRMRSHAQARGIAFDEDGFPQLNRSCFLDDWPEAIVDFYHRRARFATDQKKTLIGHFREDRLNYRRIRKVFDDIEEYRLFMGVAATDITVTADMDKEWQRFIMLINQLFIAVLAANGIKVVANIRTGSPDTVSYLSNIPKGVICISSTLGCEPLKSETDLHYIAKVLDVQPSRLLLYGKRDPIAERQLTQMGIRHRWYDDVHQAYPPHDGGLAATSSRTRSVGCLG